MLELLCVLGMHPNSFFYDNPMKFDIQYNKFDIFRHSQALSYVKSRPAYDK